MANKRRDQDSFLATAGIVLVFAPLVFLPASVHPLAYGLVALASGAALVLYALAQHRFTPLATLVAIAGALPLATLALSSALSASPGIAVLGAIGQHSGWILYAALYLWLVASVALAGPGQLRRLSVTGAVLGAALVAAMLLERAGVMSWGGRYSAVPSGVLDNPTSLAQTLVVALGCSIAWRMVSHSPAGRWGSVGCALAALAGLALTGVTTSGLAVAAAAVMAWIGATVARRRGGAPRIVASALVVVLVLSLVAVWAVSTLPTSRADSARIAGITNLRTVIWRGALALVAERPLLGRGPDHFDVWQSWSATPAGDLNVSASLDPHDSLLAVLVGGGVLSLVAVLVPVWLVAYALARAHGSRPLPTSAIVITATCAGWASSTLAAWIYLPAGLLAIALLGSVAGIAVAPPARRPDADDAAPGPWPRIPGWAAAAGPTVAGVVVTASLGIVLWSLTGPVPLEISYSWRTRLGHATGFPPAEATSAFGRWPDPEYASSALDGYFGAIIDPDSTVRPDALQLVTKSASAAEADSRLAFARIKVLQAVSAQSPKGHLDPFLAAVDVGRRADPATGLWDYLAALETLRLGRADLAARYATAALTRVQTPENVMWLEDVAAGRASVEATAP